MHTTSIFSQSRVGQKEQSTQSQSNFAVSPIPDKFVKSQILDRSVTDKPRKEASPVQNLNRNLTDNKNGMKSPWNQSPMVRAQKQQLGQPKSLGLFGLKQKNRIGSFNRSHLSNPKSPFQQKFFNYLHSVNEEDIIRETESSCSEHESEEAKGSGAELDESADQHFFGKLVPKKSAHSRQRSLAKVLSLEQSRALPVDEQSQPEQAPKDNSQVESVPFAEDAAKCEMVLLKDANWSTKMRNKQREPHINKFRPKMADRFRSQDKSLSTGAKQEKNQKKFEWAFKRKFKKKLKNLNLKFNSREKNDVHKLESKLRDSFESRTNEDSIRSPSSFFNQSFKVLKRKNRFEKLFNTGNIKFRRNNGKKPFSLKEKIRI